MIFRIKKKHEVGFKLWLEKLGYTKNELADGSSTFSGKGTRKTLSYVLLKKDLTVMRHVRCYSMNMKNTWITLII